MSEGSIRRDVKLPALASIEFDLALAGGGDSEFSMGIYCNNAAEPSSGYIFNLESSSIQLQRCFQGNSQPMSAQPLLQLQEVVHVVPRVRMHIGIRVNKETKTIWLFINGRQLGQWTDKAGFAGSGTSLMFTSGEGDYQKISNIKVSAWDLAGSTTRATPPPSPRKRTASPWPTRIVSPGNSSQSRMARRSSPPPTPTSRSARQQGIDGIVLSAEGARPGENGGQ